MILYYLVKRFEKQARENHLWNITPKDLQIGLMLLWHHSTAYQTKSFLSFIWKSIPNIPEIIKNIEMLSAFKVLASPLEKALGDDPNAFAFFRDLTRIVIVLNYINDKTEFGGSGIKYNYLHLASTGASLILKGAPLIYKWSQVGLTEGSLANPSKPMKYASEVVARFIAIAAESKKTTQSELSSLEVIENNYQASWLLQALVGGTFRSYVGEVIGKKITAFEINDGARELSNKLELLLVEWIVNNQTISFTQQDHILEKGSKCLAALEDNIVDHSKCLMFFIATIVIEVEMRTLAEIIPAFLSIAPTRMTASIFEKQMQYISDDHAVELNNFEYSFEIIVLWSASYDLYNWFIDTTNNNEQDIMGNVMDTNSGDL